ncbi:MAG: dipeptidase, partial [Deltaproteobacteria bacterium]|nr:dipeptidase [Deltaproteobacteria bacterium]
MSSANRLPGFNLSLVWLILIIFPLSPDAQEIPIALTHIDTISVYCGKIKSEKIEADFLNKKGPLILSAAIWIPRNISNTQDALIYVKQIKKCLDEKITGKDEITIIYKKDDIYRVIDQKKIALILTLEGGE